MDNKYLPVTLHEMPGLNEPDIILVTGDAYVDHPSFGAAVIGRFLEHQGYSVGIIAQPDWKSVKDFRRLGKPGLFFGITGGNMDSMVANYTANRRKRKTDDYSPGGIAGLRPDRAVIVYANRAKEAYPDVPLVIGGIEAGMRRFSHYDYWEDGIRRSILLDSKADILVYGMGEKQAAEIAKILSAGKKLNHENPVNGTCIIVKPENLPEDSKVIPSFEEVKQDKDKFNHAFRMIYENMNPYTAKPLAQKHQNRYVLQFPPPRPLNSFELDKIYDLPYTRKCHPSYEKSGGIHGLETVKFSIISHRGCPGECSFCSLFMHQGRIVQSRGMNSILNEAEIIAKSPDFRGTITDIGGPTANFYRARCDKWEKHGFCSKRRCLTPDRCPDFLTGYEESIKLYRKIRSVSGVRHVFIGSGFRYDLLSSSNPHFSQIILETAPVLL